MSPIFCAGRPHEANRAHSPPPFPCFTGVYVLTRDITGSAAPELDQSQGLPKPATATATATATEPPRSPTRHSLQPHRAPPTLTVELPGVSPPTRKLSVTLGGAQYLLARSPEAGPATFRGREVGPAAADAGGGRSWPSVAGSVFGRSLSRSRSRTMGGWEGGGDGERVEVVVVEEGGGGGE